MAEPCDPQDSYPSYLQAIWNQWKSVVGTWISGAGVIGGASLIDLIRWPVWTWILVLVAGLLVAQYQAYQKVATQLAAYKELSDLELHLEDAELPWNQPALLVTNRGETDDFQVVSEVEGTPTREYLHWDSPNEGPTKRNLVSGAHARAYFTYDGAHNAEKHVRLSFLSEKKKPLARNFVARTSLLGVVELRPADAAWPRKPDEWFEKVASLIDSLVKGLAKLKTMTDLSAARVGIDEFEKELRKSGVVAPSFIDHYYAVNRRVAPSDRYANESEDRTEEYLMGYVECVQRWISDLQTERQLEADRKKVKESWS